MSQPGSPQAETKNVQDTEPSEKQQPEVFEHRGRRFTLEESNGKYHVVGTNVATGGADTETFDKESDAKEHLKILRVAARWIT